MDPALLAHLRATKDMPQDFLASIEAKRASTVSLPTISMTLDTISDDPVHEVPRPSSDVPRRRVSFDMTPTILVPPAPNRAMTRFPLKGRKLRLDPINNCVRLNNIAGEIRLRSPVMEVDEADFSDRFNAENASVSSCSTDEQPPSLEESQPRDSESLHSSFFSDDSGSSITLNQMTEGPQCSTTSISTKFELFTVEKPKRKTMVDSTNGSWWNIFRLCWNG
jgi:hypothetical protein